MLIVIFISLILIIGILVYFYFTDRIDYLLCFQWDLLLKKLSKFEKWIVSGSLIAIIILNVFTGLFSSYLHERLRPSLDQKILKKQDEITEIAIKSNVKLDELVKSSNLDPRVIEAHIKDLPIKEGKGKVEDKINKWYGKNIIDLKEKEILLAISSAIFEHNKILSAEIQELKSLKETEVATLLESIQQYFTEGNAVKIKEVYFSREEKSKQENIIVLKQSIKATEALFAIKETNDLYQELISLEPSAENYFQFAYFLQKLNYFNEAANYYQEALKIYRELAKENPRTYLPDVAMTLNNLAVLQKAKNEFPQALEKYEEALKIYRELAKENPKTFEIDFAKMLVMGVDLFKKDKGDLKKAKRILEKYPNVYKAEKLLEIINGLE